MIDQGHAVSVPARHRLLMAHARGTWLGAVALAMHFSLTGAILMAADGVFWRNVRPPKKLALYVATLTVVGLIEILITHFGDRPQPLIERTALFGLGAICVATMIGSDRAVDQRRLLLTFAFVILAANLGTWLVGLQGQSVYQGLAPEGEMIKGLRRVQFFFAFGINAYGTTAGLFLALALADTLTTRSWFSLTVAGMALATVFLTDSRGALLAALLTVIACYLPRWRALPRMIVICSLFALPTILLLGPLLNSLFSFAIRTDGVDLTTGRASYWISITSRLPEYVNNWWLGFGLMGSTRLSIPLSNISQLSAYLRQGDALPHAHNLWLQIFLEGGILKLLVVLSLLLSIARAAARIQQNNIRRLALSFLYIPIAGMTESTFDYMRIENLLFLFVLAGVAFSNSESSEGLRRLSTKTKFERDAPNAFSS